MEYARAANYTVAPEDFLRGWARRPKRGEMYGANYVPRYEKDILRMFEAGNDNKARKMNAAEMLEHLQRSYADRYDLPCENHIRSKIGEYTIATKTGRGPRLSGQATAIANATANGDDVATSRVRLGRKSEIADQWFRWVEGIVRTEPTIRCQCDHDGLPVSLKLSRTGGRPPLTSAQKKRKMEKRLARKDRQSKKRRKSTTVVVHDAVRVFQPGDVHILAKVLGFERDSYKLPAVSETIAGEIDGNGRSRIRRCSRGCRFGGIVCGAFRPSRQAAISLRLLRKDRSSFIIHIIHCSLSVNMHAIASQRAF